MDSLPAVARAGSIVCSSAQYETTRLCLGHRPVHQWGYTFAQDSKTMMGGFGGGGMLILLVIVVGIVAWQANHSVTASRLARRAH